MSLGIFETFGPCLVNRMLSSLEDRCSLGFYLGEFNFVDSVNGKLM